MVISGRVPSSNGAQSMRIHSAVTLGYHAPSSMVQDPTESHYAYTEPTSPCPLLTPLSHIMLTLSQPVLVLYGLSLLFFVGATSMVMSESVPTSDNVYLCGVWYY